MISLTVAKAKRDNLFSQIQAIFDFTKKISDPNILQQLLIKAKSLDRLRQEFSDTLDLCHELELKEDDTYVPNYAPLTSANELVDYIHSTVATIEAKRHAAKLKAESSNPPLLPQINVRLPKLELRSFTGDPISWVSFINLFNSSIHNNATLSGVMKFQYLLSVVSGEPLTLINSLPITETNYKVAYDLLQSRYHSPRRLVTLHISKLLDLPSINYKPSSMRSFVNAYNENMQALKGLGTDISKNNPLLSTILLRKLDADLRRRFEHDRVPSDDENAPIIPEAGDIIVFLDRECTEAETANLSSDTKYPTHKEKAEQSKRVHFPSKKVSLVSTTVDTVPQPLHSDSKSPPCFCCSKLDHKIYFCPTFKSKTPNERYSLVKTLNRCVSCLGNHDLKMCQSKGSCHTCNKRHHTLLHFQASRPANTQTGTAPASSSYTSTLDVTSPNSKNVLSSSVAMAYQGYHSPSLDGNYTVLLGTALIKLKGPEGNTQVFRALLDSGSMCNLITERAAQLLNTRRHKSTVKLCGLSQNMTGNKGKIFADLETLSGDTLACHQSLVVLERLTVDLPRMPISPQVFSRTHQYILADPTFHVPSPIDVVIGGAHFAQLMTGSTYSLGEHMPHAVGTRLGYVIMGSAPCATPSYSSSASSATVTMLSTTDTDLHTSLQHFWQLEEPPTFVKKNEEEVKCDSHFKSTHSREPSGRYMVKLPFKEEIPSLGTSRPIAERRFRTLEQKFITSTGLCSSYSQAMRDHISQGHLVKATPADLATPHYYLPHHGVMKEGSSTTKLRIVFDASCKTSSGQSLNDTLLIGPKLQVDIVDILLQFRTHKIVLTCDIRQMYLQILVHPSHQPFQLVLWRNNATEDLETYKLTRVTFGVNSSPYLACRTLRQLADDEGLAFPEASHVLKTQTYIDDIICGADSVAEAKALQSQLIQLLKKGGFELRKWVSNSKDLLQTVPPDHLECPGFLFNSEEPHFSILGMLWSPQHDCFTYRVTPLNTIATKRNVLSFIAKIYDPCGFASPTIMLAKCFIQLLWTSGLSWDEPLSADLAKKWHDFVQDTQSLSKLAIPRSFELSHSHHLECHGFCDASEMGFSAVVYFKCHLPDQQVIIRPVIAKTRVAPLKRVTIPRLELCAAHLLSKLIVYCSTTLKNKIDPNNTYLWSDSTVVLTWIRTPPYRLKTYVANRVAQIQELVNPEAWRHVSTKDNPADCASRGIPASQLVAHPLWWNGPSWLQLPNSEWPTPDLPHMSLDSSDEMKQTPLTVLVTTQKLEWSLLSRYSSWTRLQRVTAWILRFVNNLRSKNCRTGLLSVSDLNSAKQKIFTLVQHSAFAEDISNLQKNKSCSTRIQRLKPFIHNDGLLRVGGRLNLSSLPPDARNPILLPKSHHVVDLLIDHYHTSHLHSGPQLTQALLSQQVWILSARSVIRSRIFKCVKCFRNKPRNKTPLMADLPPPRVTPARAFSSTGIDYAGPFSCKILNLKSIRFTKVYLCLFVCLSTKAVHIEVVQDLTTNSFIAALTRFVSRRGLCTDIYSDCGTNFVGANTALRNIVESLHHSEGQEKIQNFSTSRGIRFHFNPPAAPHQGGLWESAVKSAKHHLRRTMGETVLTLPELITLSTQIEAMLNSRPLTPLSQDPSDLSALTPGHFLIGAPLAAVPEENLLLTPQHRLKQWQLVQLLNQRIWRRWHLEYLNTLHQRVKWSTPVTNLSVGDLVLVHSSSAPLDWPLARIVATHPGVDGVVRVVDLKTATGTLTRPVTKVFPLPID